MVKGLKTPSEVMRLLETRRYSPHTRHTSPHHILDLHVAPTSSHSDHSFSTAREEKKECICIRVKPQRKKSHFTPTQRPISRNQVLQPASQPIKSKRPTASRHSTSHLLFPPPPPPNIPTTFASPPVHNKANNTKHGAHNPPSQQALPTRQLPRSPKPRNP